MRQSNLDPLYQRLCWPKTFDSTKDLSILIVSDFAGFTETSDPSLSFLIEILRSELTPNNEILTAAHRSCGAGTCQEANIPNLTFDQCSLQGIDEVWLFGFRDGSTSNLLPTEVEAMTEFMNRGGGVFATGDHDNIGLPLCGEIPRVKSMRCWGKDVETRPGMDLHNTLSTVAGDEFCDAVPQRIYPRLYFSSDDWQFESHASPHPVLFGPLGTISVLPDHKHEGRVEVPEDPQSPEFPIGRKNKVIKPETIANAINICDSSSFGSIGAYDGHKTSNKVGRIIVDSTWHHFIDKNLRQFRCQYNRVMKVYSDGTAADPTSLAIAKDFYQMRAYFANIARWLEPPAKKSARLKRVFNALLRNATIQMVLRRTDSLPNDPERIVHYLTDIGTKAHDELAREGLASDATSINNHIIEELNNIDENLRIGDFSGPRSHFFRHSRIDPNLGANLGLGAALHFFGQIGLNTETDEATPETVDFLGEQAKNVSREIVRSLMLVDDISTDDRAGFESALAKLDGQ